MSAHGDYLAMVRGCESRQPTFGGQLSVRWRKERGDFQFRLISKDCFWNCENVTVRDSFISGEYLAWNSRNVTFEHCTIEKPAGPVLPDIWCCVTAGSSIRRSRSNIPPSVPTHGTIDSVFNPSSGTIRADHINEMTLDPAKIDPTATTIVTADAA